jgi:hypothetical protein
VEIHHLIGDMWGLAHMAGTFTTAHQDVAGTNVAGSVLGDPADPVAKIWGVMKFKDSSLLNQDDKKSASLIGDICVHAIEHEGDRWYWDKAQWQDRLELDVMYLRPGDILCVSMAHFPSIFVTKIGLAFNPLAQSTLSILPQHASHLGRITSASIPCTSPNGPEGSSIMRETS